MASIHDERLTHLLTESASRRTALRGLGGLAALLAVVGSHRRSHAQEASPTPAYAPGVHATILGRKEAVAAPGYYLQLTHILFDPGSSVPPHSHPGDTVTYQLAGAHAFTVLAGTATLVRAGTAPPAADEPVGEAMALNQEYLIETGDVLLFDAETVHVGANPTDEPAVLFEAQLRAVGQPLTLPLATPTS